ncbi:MAG: release factor glutamine methyltransferase [Actinomycetota bacterium]|nr:release factor glutamine methyltransferase [Actinomycetota bacterium]
MTAKRSPARLRVAIDVAHDRLAAAGVPSPRHDAETLAAFVLGCPRGHLHVAGDLSAGQHTVYAELVARRARRIPLQHLTGSAAFRYIEVAVGPGVFVPRPETEVVAGWCIDALLARTEETPEPLVVDLCTGSAAIALSIAHEVKGAVVHAVERERAAYEWASRNVTGTRVVVHHADAADALAELDGTVDLVVGNPPYLPEGQRGDVDPEVRDHDPDAALWGGPDGLLGPHLIELAARRLLRHGGLVAVEHADHQGPLVAELFRASGEWEHIAVRQDLAGRDRFVTAQRDRTAD